MRSLIEEEEQTFTFYAFPESMHRHIQTTNAIESLWSLVRQRTDQIDVFTTETSCLAIGCRDHPGHPLAYCGKETSFVFDFLQVEKTDPFFPETQSSDHENDEGTSVDTIGDGILICCW